MSAREQNRLRFPFITQCVDALREAGFTAKVIYAEECGNQVGKEPEKGSDWPMCSVELRKELKRIA